MEKIDTTNRSLSPLIIALIWLLLCLAQSFMLAGSSPTTPNFWSDPKLYYSVWLVDLYLIILYYINYHFIAAAMIRAKQYLAYTLVVVLAMVVALLLPILFYHLWGWTIPTAAEGTTPLFAEAMVWALALMAIGLAFRSVKEWIRLSDLQKSNQQELNSQTERVKQLEMELSNLKANRQVPTASNSEAQSEMGTFENLSSQS